MSRRDEYLKGARERVLRDGLGVVDDTYDAGRQEGYAAAIADALRVLDGTLGALSPDVGRGAGQVLQIVRDRIAALAPAEPPQLSERAREWADAIVAYANMPHKPADERPLNGATLYAIGGATRDPEILASINEAARRLRGDDRG